MTRLSGLDAWLLEMEDAVTHLHHGSAAIFEGPTPPFAELRHMVLGKLPLVPRYRQRVRPVPLGAGRPVLAADPHFNIDYHVRHTALPPPGSREQLHNLMGRVMANKLDLTKPLWEMWVVEGLQDGRWALISKTHHALVDGITGTALLSVLLDDSPEPSQPVPDTWRPPPEPSDVRLLGEALADRVLNPSAYWRAAQSVRHAPAAALRQAGKLARGVAAVTGVSGGAPDSSLSGPIGPHRRYAWARISLADVTTIREGLAHGNGVGLTVNDVILAVAAQGFRDLLWAHGEPPAARVVRSLVPVSVRRSDERGAYTNDVAAVAVDLPVSLADPVARAHAIHDQMAELTGSGRAVAAETLMSWSGFAPPLLLALGVRAATRAAGQMGDASVLTVVTNAPGPAHLLYALGRPMVEVVPCPAIAAPVRVSLAVYSYDGQLTFGATGDWDAVPDLDVLCAGVEAGIADLVAAAKT